MGNRVRDHGRLEARLHTLARQPKCKGFRFEVLVKVRKPRCLGINQKVISLVHEDVLAFTPPVPS